MDILKHTIHKSIYDLCGEIEKLPASDQATKCVVMASDLHSKADILIDALRDAISCFQKQKSCVTEERLETWKKFAEVE